MEKEIIIRKKRIHLDKNKIYTELNDNIKKVFEKDEEIIINYLERYIFNALLSNTTKTDIHAIIEQINENILNTINTSNA